MQEVRHTVAHHLRLVSDAEDTDIRRQFLLKLVQHLVDFIAHCHDVLPLLHLDGEQEALTAVVSDVAVGVRIFAHHPCHVFQPHGVALRIGIDYLFLHIAYGIE